MIEVLKQMQEALREYHYYTIDAGLPNQSMLNKGYAAYQAGLKAIAELESKEPVAWQERQAKRMKEGIVTEWSNWYSCDHRSINDARAEIYDHIPYEWRPLYAHPPQRTEQEPVAWLLTEKNINSLQVDSIQLLIDRLKHAHHTDLCVRINGQDEWFQADWLKHMVRATPPQRTWVGLTTNEIVEALNNQSPFVTGGLAVFARALEAKLKEKNT
jgi:hypothetical protein